MRTGKFSRESLACCSYRREVCDIPLRIIVCRAAEERPEYEKTEDETHPQIAHTAERSWANYCAFKGARSFFWSPRGRRNRVRKI